jgi:hypothetical protein
MTIMKLESQLKIVETAFACIRVRRLVSSAGSSQVIPSQEMPKKLLKTNSMTTAVIPYLSSSTGAPVSSSSVPVETMPEDGHSARHTDSTEEHESAPTDTVDCWNGEKRRHEVLGAIEGGDESG